MGNERIGYGAAILYKGGYEGQEPFDDHSTGEPLRVLLGEQQVPVGIEQALMEMEVGEERTVVLTPELGYGVRAEDRVQWYPRQMIPNGYKLEVGSILTYVDKGRGGLKKPGRVIEETKDAVRVDFNHPLAGETLVYWVKLVELV